VEFKVHKVNIKTTAFWDMTPCTLVERYQRFGEKYYLHSQGRKVKVDSKHRKLRVSITKPNRLMLFRETVAVYCENHMEHINEREREERNGEVVRDTTFWGSKKERNYTYFRF
jgi:hypothetical protein